MELETCGTHEDENFDSGADGSEKTGVWMCGRYDWQYCEGRDATPTRIGLGAVIKENLHGRER